LSSKANLADEFWPGGLPKIKRSFRSSIAYRLCLVANGEFDGMLTLRPTWEWDVAAGSLIASEAGGLATDQNGRELVFNSPIGQLNGIVSSNSCIHAGLMNGLR
jgi:Archaeal fructose-1,6-bisphosphatase and related enzymes of inositol monophosphatase family